MANNTPPVGSLLPNSNKYKEQQTALAVKSNSKQELVTAKIRKKPLEKVGTSEAVIKEKTISEKLADAFIAEKPKAVKDYLIEEKIVPELKEFFLDLLFDGLSMLVGTKRRGGSGDRTDYSTISTSRSSYRYAPSSNYYTDRRPAVSDSGPRSTSEDPCEVIFKINPYDKPNEAKDTAKQVLSDLRDAALEYNTASVADLYDLAGVSPKSFTDNDYGWTPDLLQYAIIKRVREGYALELPHPIPID